MLKLYTMKKTRDSMRLTGKILLAYSVRQKGERKKRFTIEPISQITMSATTSKILRSRNPIALSFKFSHSSFDNNMALLQLVIILVVFGFYLGN